MPLGTSHFRFESTNVVVGNHWGGKANAFGRSLGCAVENIFVKAVIFNDEKNIERDIYI
jgi:hypothetical protein